MLGGGALMKQVSRTAKAAGLRVMEYVQQPAGFIQGWVLLEPDQYRKWAKAPSDARKSVTGYCIITGMEQCAEWGTVYHNRLWDYRRTLAEVPARPFDANTLEDEMRLAE